VTARAAQKKFDVEFDKSRVTVAQMLDAMKGLGYQPSQDGAVGAMVDAPAMTATARSGAAGYGAGADGQITINLAAKEGHRLGGDGQAATRIVVVGTEAVKATTAETKVSDAVAATQAREVKVPIKVVQGVKPGEQVVIVRITFQSRKGDTSLVEQTVELRVPVTVQ
jgi:hypothetical protein